MSSASLLSAERVLQCRCPEDAHHGYGVFFQDLGSTRTLDSHACRLRAKLERDGDRFVVNVWGVGYRLVDGPVGES